MPSGNAAVACISRAEIVRVRDTRSADRRPRAARRYRRLRTGRSPAGMSIAFDPSLIIIGTCARRRVREEQADAGGCTVCGALAAAADAAARRGRCRRSSRHGIPAGATIGTAPGRPPEKMAVGILRALRDHAVVARLSIRAVAAPRRSRAIDADDGVVDERRRPGRNSTARTKRSDGSATRQHEVAKHVAIARPHGVRAWHGDDEIRLAELPAVGPDWSARADPQGCPRPRLRSPSAESLQSQRAGDAGRRRTPRGPAQAATGGMCPVARHLDDLVRARPDVRETQQAERRRLSRPMARRTVLEQDRRDVLAEGGRRRRRERQRRAAKAPCTRREVPTRRAPLPIDGSVQSRSHGAQGE